MHKKAFSHVQYVHSGSKLRTQQEPMHYRLRCVDTDGGCAAKRRIATPPGIAGVQFSLLKCLETHDITYIYIMNQKKPKYSTKSATRTFVGGGAKLDGSPLVRTRRAFFTVWTRNLAGT